MLTRLELLAANRSDSSWDNAKTGWGVIFLFAIWLKMLYNAVMVEFGERIYNLRKKSGLSQEEFADKLGVSRQAVSKWETGQSVPDSEKAAAIGSFFGVSLDWLINGVEPVVSVTSAASATVAERKPRAGWVKALIIAGIVTLASIGVSALSAFVFMLVMMKSANLADTGTFYMLLMVVPGWIVLFAAVFIISMVVIRKKQKNKPPQ